MIIMRGDASLHIQRDKDLSAFNTLALPVRVSHFCEVADLVELRQAVNFGISKGLQIIPLGQGSNVVFSSDLNALVVSINFPRAHSMIMWMSNFPPEKIGTKQ